jgi:signal peptidase II
MTAKLRIFLAVLAIALPLDQLTKWWINANLTINFSKITVIDGFFYITHVRNPGAAFGFLRDADPSWRIGFFIGVSVLASFLVLGFFRSIPEEDRYTAASLGLIFSGAVGNLIDRVRFHEVIDFLHFRLWQGYSWPDFNVADSCIVVGVGLLMLQMFWNPTQASEGSGEEE